jgi:hypothetical protein
MLDRQHRGQSLAQPSALSQLKIRVELKPVRWTSSPSVPEFVDGLEVRHTLILSFDKALGRLCSEYGRSLRNSPPRARRGRLFGVGLAFFLYLAAVD